jgi:hypothetical protein
MLNSNSNPILLVHPSCDSYTGFNSLITSPYVKIDYSASTSDFKPLDIAWVQKRMMGKNYYHVGVYLGNGEICSMADPGVSNPVNLIAFSQRMKADITS